MVLHTVSGERLQDGTALQPRSEPIAFSTSAGKYSCRLFWCRGCKAEPHCNIAASRLHFQPPRENTPAGCVGVCAALGENHVVVGHIFEHDQSVALGMDSFFHCINLFAVLNDGFLNDLLKKLICFEAAKVLTFSELTKYFSYIGPTSSTYNVFIKHLQPQKNLLSSQSSPSSRAVSAYSKYLISRIVTCINSALFWYTW